MSDWKTIESAPIDRQVLLCFGADSVAYGIFVGFWSFVSKEWVVPIPKISQQKRICISALGNPTHWQPLPPPPTTEEK